MKKFDFERWYGVADVDNCADDYYEEGACFFFCDDCGNLMVPIENGHKCPFCGCTEGRALELDLL